MFIMVQKLSVKPKSMHLLLHLWEHKKICLSIYLISDLCGSILGPLFFLIYVNYLYDCWEKLNFVIFTDDTSLPHSGMNLYDLFSDMNCEFNKIFLYIKSKKILLNLTKKFFKKKRFFLNMDNIAIERENVTKFLGIKFLVTKISHGNDVTTKILKSIGILYKSREIVQQPLLKQLNIFLFTLIWIM